MWRVENSSGHAAEFHERAIPDVVVPTVWRFDVHSSALVLGSSQRIEQIDQDACVRAGIDIVRRRSGGGAVLLQPGDATWVDVLLPVTDARWTSDIGRSTWWLGDVWQRALTVLGVVGTTVHRGPLVRTTWSEHVCFAGIGGGEVIRAGRKVIGISQRRTRSGARFQCVLYHTWRPAVHAALFASPGPTADDLVDLAITVDVASAVVLDAFASALFES